MTWEAKTSSYTFATVRPLRPSQGSLAFVRKGAIDLKDLMMISSYLSASYDTSFSQIRQTFFTIVNSALVDGSKSC